MTDSFDIRHSQSNDSLYSIGARLKSPASRFLHMDAHDHSLKPAQTEKRFITNLSAGRIDELSKRIQEQDLIIANQNKRIDVLEHKLSVLMDILERNNDIWFHRELIHQDPSNA